MERRTGWVVAAIVAAAVWVAASQQPLVAQAGDRYGYFYKGKLVSLKASPRLIAMEGGNDASLAFATETGLRLDGLSKETNFRARGLTVYQMPVGGKGAQLQSDAVLTAAMKRKLRVQPVFESGMAVTIPSDEVIVGFKKSTTLTGAQRFLAGYSNRFGISGVRTHRPNTFIVTINAPADGRVFGVSRALSKVPGIAFSEPNLVFTMVREGPEPLNVPSLPPPGAFKPVGPIEGADANGPQAQLGTIDAAPNWQTLLSEGFEGPLNGWSAVMAQGATEALPLITTARKHGGTKSLYLTGGGAEGVPPPGPYPPGCQGGIDSPPLNLDGFEEVYVEFWFYAKYEQPGQQIFDYCLVGVVDPNAGTGKNLSLLAVSFTGDLTTDPTSKAGWRRVLARIPPAFRKNGVTIRTLFLSDTDIGAEGVYVDDFRVVGAADVDTQPLGNDTYGGRAYELQNVGQIAALGNDSNDLNCPEAWAIQAVSQNVIVAVIDTGVDLNHQDLNLVTGYDANGQVGGAPVAEGDNHGTACAGNVGAKRNNSIGVIGTAPGVKIMPIHWGTTLGELATSIDVAVQHGAKVLSNSWGFGDGTVSQDIENAIDAALAANRILVFAAGNGPDRPPFAYNVAFPGILTATKNIITVGATSPTDEHKASASSDGLHSWGSSYVGAGPDVCAPGPWSYTTDRLGALGYNTDQAESGIDTGYEHDFGGTSSSTPKVAGIVALMLSRNPNLTPVQVKNLLRSTAKDIETAGVDDKTGAGRVDTLKAVQQSGGGDATITVTAPNGGQNWQLGTSQNITWTSSGVTGNVKIELSRNGGGAYETLFASAANDGTQAWNVAGAASTNCRVRVSQASDAAINDVSNAAFAIAAATDPSITVTSPNGSENWQIGIAHTITWSSNDVSGNVKIELSRNGGGAYETLFASVGNDGSQAWTVAGAASTNCRIRISQASDAAVNDVSNAAFTISKVPNPTVTVNSPNGGENWTLGTSQNIMWDTSDLTGNVKVELSRNGGGNFEVLFSSTGNDGIQGWSVGGAASTNCIIRISQASNAAVNDSSDGTFIIAAPANPTATPTNLSATPTSETSIDVTWTDNAQGEDGYKLEYKVGNGAFQPLPDPLAPDSGGSTFSDATPGTTYTFRVRCYKGGTHSAYSNTDTVTTPGSALTAPSSLLAKAQRKKKIKLTWRDNSNNEDGFAVEIDDGTGFREIGVVSANSTGAIVNRLKAKKFYNFRVRAKLGNNYSDYSNTSGAKAKK